MSIVHATGGSRCFCWGGGIVSVDDDDAKGQLVSAAGSPLRQLHMRASRSFRDYIGVAAAQVLGFLAFSYRSFGCGTFAMAVKITSSPSPSDTPYIHNNSMVVVVACC
jgi:hypothetical protein